MSSDNGGQAVGRISHGQVVMVVAGLLGAILTLASLRAADDRRSVLVANRDLAPGTVLDDTSLRVVRIEAPADLLGALYGPDDRERLTGAVTATAVRSGTPMTRDVVRAGADVSLPRTMSFPIPSARAVGGALVAGDRVDVLVVGRDREADEYVVTGADLLAIDGDARGPLGAADDLTITLAVDDEIALRLAGALERGVVTVVRATGAAETRDG
jgi:Flp pilus assembly protein CpaB